MDRRNIEKIARTPEDKVLLAKVWDKINMGMRKNIPSNTCFLSERELDMTRYLFGSHTQIHAFGGYPDAQRKMLVFLPDYLDTDSFYDEEAPLVCLRAAFYEGDNPTHRDFLGALMGFGIARETVGDICVGQEHCDFFVSGEVAPHILRDFTGAGRTKLSITRIPLTDVDIPQPETKQIKDTLASLRLDSVVSAGFRIGRSLAAQHITAGKAAINGLPCEKPDRLVEEGSTVSVRGLGKIKLISVGSTTKKGRISVVIDRYV